MTEAVGKMEALVKQGPSVALRTVARPCVSRSDDVIVHVMAAGLCRTDVYVADGRIRAVDPVILGHEFSGVISDVGPAVQDLSPGDRVTAMPAIPCGACALCRGGDRAHCGSRGFLGIDWQGAFAEYVRVPRSAVHRIPDGLSFRQGAYVEPVAAALGVLRAELPRDGRGLVWGTIALPSSLCESSAPTGSPTSRSTTNSTILCSISTRTTSPSKPRRAPSRCARS